MNQKLQRIIRDIERAKAKITELQALLPELERQKTELENVELIKLFRTANISPADFTAFMETYKANLNAGARLSAQLMPHSNTMEDEPNENEV